LKCQPADDDCDTDVLVECLGKAGCDDALVGIGRSDLMPAQPGSFSALMHEGSA